MTRRELIAFDKIVAKYLCPKNVASRLTESLEADYNLLMQGSAMHGHSKIREFEHESEMLRQDNE